MGWFDDNGNFQSGMPPTTPPPAGEGWVWDGFQWTRPETTNPWPGQPVPPGTLPPGGYPTPSPPPITTTPGVLSGWDATKWGDSAHTTPKYVAGRILAKYPPTVEGLKQAIPELQKAFPGLTFNGKDTITLPGLGPIDVLQGASTGGVAWQWIDQANAGTGAVPPVAPYTGVPPVAPYTGGAAFGGGDGGETGGGGLTSTGIYRSPAPTTSTTPTSRTTSAWSPGTSPTFTGTGPFTPPAAPPPAQGWTPSAFTPAAITPKAAPTPFTFAGQSPQGYTGGPKLDALTSGPTLKTRSDFTYDPLKSSTPFVLPTGQEALNQDPGYQFRLEQGLKALQNSAAGQGLLRTGGTLKGIQDFGQQAASQEYQNAFGRARDTYGLNQAVRQSEQGQQFGQNLSATQQNQAQDLAQFNAALAAQGQTFQQAATQNTINEGQNLAAYNANLAGQNQGFQQALSGATLNSQNVNAAAERDLTAQQQTQANALAASNATNAFGLQAAGFNADQTQLGYRNLYDAANQSYAYGQTQNLAANQQALAGYQFDAGQNLSAYQTDVNRDLAQQGLNITSTQNAAMNDLAQQGLNLTAQQNAVMNSLNAQQQSWMQIYMQNGQSFDQAYKLLMAKLQYPTYQPAP